MMKNNRGAALLQVLMLSALLAGLSVMVLRAALSRQVTARQTRHAVGTQLAIESCMAEINNMWAIMAPETYKNYLNSCSFPTFPEEPCDDQPKQSNTWYCRVKPFDSQTYCVTAKIQAKAAGDSTDSPCKIEFSIKDGINL